MSSSWGKTSRSSVVSPGTVQTRHCLKTDGWVKCGEPIPRHEFAATCRSHCHLRLYRTFSFGFRNFRHRCFSVNSNTLATETAFSSAVRATLAGLMIRASTRSTYSLRAASKPILPWALQHSATTWHVPVAGTLQAKDFRRSSGDLRQTRPPWCRPCGFLDRPAFIPVVDSPLQ